MSRVSNSEQVKSVNLTFTTGSMSMKMVRLMVKLVRELGEESKVLSDLIEPLKSFYEPNTNDQIIFPILSLCRLTFSTYPVPYPPRYRIKGMEDPHMVGWVVKLHKWLCL